MSGSKIDSIAYINISTVSCNKNKTLKNQNDSITAHFAAGFEVIHLMEIKQSQIDSLIDDVAYLEHEAEALKYVIDSVPYNKKPSDGKSIAEILHFLDHAQQKYYRRVIEDSYKHNRPINLNSYVDPEESYERDEELLEDIQKLLYKISKHRVALLNLMKNMQLIDWEKEITRGRSNFTLYDFTKNMALAERKTLKEVAELVMTYQNASGSQSELESENKNN